MNLLQDISDTARWIAAYRAVESERQDALFHDPFARALAGPRGFEIAQVLPGAFSVAVRTRVLDDLILQQVSAGADAVLSLAAGLDARPWRLNVPSSLCWYEVDLPHVIAYKQQQLVHHKPHCQLTQFGLNLADAEGRRTLFSDVAAKHARVLILSEGFIAYLEQPAVESLARQLHQHPQFSHWLLDHLSPAVIEHMQKKYAAHLSEGPAAWKFAPANMEFFSGLGWDVECHHVLVDDGKRLNREERSAKILRLMLWLSGEKRRRAMRQRLPGCVLLRAVRQKAA